MDKQALSEYLTFMEEYAAFFEQTAAQEEEKKTALKSNQLKRIEQALSRQQAVVMEMGNLEKRRLALQRAAGLEDGTFEGISASLEGVGRIRFDTAVERLQKAVRALKEENAQSMEIAQEKLEIISSVLPEVEREAYSPYSKKGHEKGKNSIFSSKI